MLKKEDTENLVLSNLDSQLHYEMEASQEELKWNCGCYDYLLYRSQYGERKKQFLEKIKELEVTSDTKLPFLRDASLESVFKNISNLHKQKTLKGNTISAYEKTGCEKRVLSTILKELEKPRYKHVEVYPSQGRDKLLIGNYVPDIVIFGLKIKGFNAVIIEVNGGVHNDKMLKDSIMEKHLNELGFYVWSIDNHNAFNYDYITEAISSMYVPNRKSLQKQILNTKRKIWCKTISMNINLSELSLILPEYSLEEGLRYIKSHKHCPRELKNSAVKFEPHTVQN